MVIPPANAGDQQQTKAGDGQTGAATGQTQAATAAATSRLITMAMPPPRGVATLWLRRSPGWSSNCLRRAYTRAAQVNAALSRARPSSAAITSHGMVQSTA